MAIPLSLAPPTFPSLLSCVAPHRHSIDGERDTVQQGERVGGARESGIAKCMQTPLAQDGLYNDYRFAADRS